MFASALFNDGIWHGSHAATHVTSHGNTFQFTFDADMEGWVTDFADYPVGDEIFYELEWDWDSLPEPLVGNGILVSGNNHSDDLFMFVKKQVGGLQPSTAYTVTFDIAFATDVPSGCAGIGGAPGESVFVKVGATTVEPEKVVVDSDYRMNIDKGNQSTDGDDAVVVGDVANSRQNCESGPHEIKALNNSERPLVVSTDNSGSMWLFVGTDSGFEGRTTIYYATITVTALQVADSLTSTPIATPTAIHTPTAVPTSTLTPTPTSSPTPTSITPAPTSTLAPTPGNPALPQRIYFPIMPY